MRWVLVVLCCLTLAGCADAETDEPEAEVANPASVYCEEQGGTVEIRTDDTGEQLGVCVFDDGSECEEWALYRGECEPGEDTADATDADAADDAGDDTADVEVSVFFVNDQLGDPCGEVFPVTRRVSAEGLVAGTVAALVAGPDAEERADGYGGWFSTDTRDVVRSVDVVEGTAVVDFVDLREIIPNASTSCGSAALLSQLDATLSALPGVETTHYTIEGSADVFYEWLQHEAPPSPTGS